MIEAEHLWKHCCYLFLPEGSPGACSLWLLDELKHSRLELYMLSCAAAMSSCFHGDQFGPSFQLLDELKHVQLMP